VEKKDKPKATPTEVTINRLSAITALEWLEGELVGKGSLMLHSTRRELLRTVNDIRAALGKKPLYFNMKEGDKEDGTSD
jgi:hypothetical protein